MMDSSTGSISSSSTNGSSPERRRVKPQQAVHADGRSQCVLSTLPNQYALDGSADDCQGKNKTGYCSSSTSSSSTASSLSTGCSGQELRRSVSSAKNSGGGSSCSISSPSKAFRSKGSIKLNQKRGAVPSNSSNKIGIFKLFVYWIILLMTWMTFQISSMLSDHHSIDQSLHSRLQLPSIYDNDRCIFLISMGRQAAESKIVERFVMSTRRRGSWKGHVVLLTDAPHERYQHLQDQDEQFIVMHPKPEHFNWNTKKDMPYKRFKTYVLDYIDSDTRLDTVRLVYYLDVDIIVGNTLSTFFDDIETWYDIHSYSKLELDSGEVDSNTGEVYAPKVDHSNIYFFEGNFAKTPVQGGQIILERDSSKNCLLWWRSMMDVRTNETKDQPFLKVIKENNHNNTWNCHMSIMKQEPHLHFPSKESVAEMNSKWRSERHYHSLIHIKNTGKVRNIPDEDETIYISDVLHLRFWDPNADVGRKMHFDPDEPPWSPDAKLTQTKTHWSPTYAETNVTVDWLVQ